MERCIRAGSPSSVARVAKNFSCPSQAEKYQAHSSVIVKSWCCHTCSTARAQRRPSMGLALVSRTCNTDSKATTHRVHPFILLNKQCDATGWLNRRKERCGCCRCHLTGGASCRSQHAASELFFCRRHICKHADAASRNGVLQFAKISPECARAKQHDA